MSGYGVRDFFGDARDRWWPAAIAVMTVLGGIAAAGLVLVGIVYYLAKSRPPAATSQQVPVTQQAAGFVATLDCVATGAPCGNLMTSERLLAQAGTFTYQLVGAGPVTVQVGTASSAQLEAAAQSATLQGTVTASTVQGAVQLSGSSVQEQVQVPGQAPLTMVMSFGLVGGERVLSSIAYQPDPGRS